MITLKDVLNSTEEIQMLEGTTEEIIAQGLGFAYRDMMSYIGDIHDGEELENVELFLMRQQKNIVSMLSLLDEEVVYKMLDQVQEDTKKRVRK